MTSERNNIHALALNGTVKNLLNANIAVMRGSGHSMFEAGGALEWSGAEKPAKLANIGTINSVFMLMEPKAKISEQDAVQAYEALPAEQVKELSQVLRDGLRQTKGKSPRYCIVSQSAAIVARVSLQRDLEYMLVPIFETKLNEQKVHIGFVPAQLLFEKLES